MTASRSTVSRARVPKLPAVLSTFHTSGSVDYLLHIAVATTEDLRDWVLDNLATDPVVGHTETTLVFDHIQGNHGPLPVTGPADAVRPGAD